MAGWNESSDATYQAQVASLQAALPEANIAPAAGTINTPAPTAAQQLAHLGINGVHSDSVPTDDSSWLDELNDEQRAAVEATEGYVCLHAGAGTGKTRTLTYRYAYLISEYGIAPRAVWCVTFTNRAALEMKQRVQRMCGNAIGNPFVTTFHGFCALFLREEINAIGWPKTFTISDVSDVKDMLRPLYSECKIDGKKLSLKKAWEFIDGFKETKDYIAPLIGPDSSELLRRSEEATEDTLKLFWRYLFAQRTTYSLDFDDLILLTLHILKNNDEVRERWQQRLEYILVDEFQDIDRDQYELVEILAAHHHNLFIVGDPDQTIYSFRGARVEYFNNFVENHGEEALRLYLTYNYRSSAEILAAAYAVISHNHDENRKPLLAKRTDITLEQMVPVRDPNRTQDNELSPEVAAALNDRAYYSLTNASPENLGSSIPEVERPNMLGKSVRAQLKNEHRLSRLGLTVPPASSPYGDVSSEAATQGAVNAALEANSTESGIAERHYAPYPQLASNNAALNAYWQGGAGDADWAAEARAFGLTPPQASELIALPSAVTAIPPAVAALVTGVPAAPSAAATPNAEVTDPQTLSPAPAQLAAPPESAMAKPAQSMVTPAVNSATPAHSPATPAHNPASLPAGGKPNAQLQALTGISDLNALTEVPNAQGYVRSMKPVIGHAGSIYREAEFVAKTIVAIRALDPKASIAVLYRAHYIALNLENALVQNKIPYCVVGEQRFFDRKEIRDVIAYIRLRCNLDDDVAFRRIVNVPARNFGKKRMEHLESLARSSGCSLFRTLVNHLDDKFLCARPEIQNFVKVMTELAITPLGNPVDDFELIVNNTGYEEWIKNNGEDERLENISALKNYLYDFRKNQDDEVNLADFIGNVTLMTSADEAHLSRSVRLMTVHNAKGLEFDYVFVVSLNEAVFPSKKAVNELNVEEERRLMYVAMTRAQKQLILTEAGGYITVRQNNDQMKLPREPSRFLREITPDLYAEVGAPFPCSKLKAVLKKNESTPNLNLSSNDAVSGQTTQDGASAQPNLVGAKVFHKIFGEGTIRAVRYEMGEYAIYFDKLKKERTLSFSAKLEFLSKPE